MPTLAEEFTAFWALYPRRVSRQDAEKAYQRARIVATADELLAGARAFAEAIASEQRGPDERRFIPHAATWLNKGRWTDEYDIVVEKPMARDWFEECQDIHGGACEERLRHHHRKQMDAFKKASGA